MTETHAAVIPLPTAFGTTLAGGLRLDTVERAVRDIAAGKLVVVIDDADRENEGDLIFAAEHATTELLSFVVRFSSGFVCVALTEVDADRLDLPPMVRRNQDRHGTAYAVTVDARDGVTTGISAADRAHTIRSLAGADTNAAALSRPGHVVPLRARAGGVLRRAGHTEAATDLATLAGLRPAAGLCEIVSEARPTEMARGPELREFADRHGLAMISIAELIDYRRRFDKLVERVASARVPLAAGDFTAVGYGSCYDDREHVAFVFGDVDNGRDVPVRVHNECLTGDVFASLRCDCSEQLQTALASVAAAGRGVVIYLRGNEGPGIGLLRKLEQYQRQDAGSGTHIASRPVDPSDRNISAQILADLGVRTMRVLTGTTVTMATG